MPKLRAAIVVFLVGFALGLSVFRRFAAVRPRRSEQRRDRRGGGARRAAHGRQADRGERRALLRRSATAISTCGRRDRQPASRRDAILSGKPLIAEGEIAALVEWRTHRRGNARSMSSLLGLSESAIKRVAVPVIDGKAKDRNAGRRGRPDRSTRFAQPGLQHGRHGDRRPRRARGHRRSPSLVTRGRGFGNQKRPFDASALPRDPAHRRAHPLRSDRLISTTRSSARRPPTIRSA